MRWDDRFYIDLVHDTVKWLYLAPAGGAFVCNEFPITLLESMLQKHPDLSADVVFSFIEYRSYRREAMPGTCLYTQYEHQYKKVPISEGNGWTTINRIRTMMKAKELINEYCVAEFSGVADFSDLHRIGVAYTTVTDQEHAIQVNINLIDHRIETFLNDSLVTYQSYESLEEMVRWGLENLNFDDLIYLPDWVIREYEKTVNKEKLAAKLVLFYKRVDLYGYLDMLEIGETEFDAIAKTRRALDNPSEIRDALSEFSMMIQEHDLTGILKDECYDIMDALHQLYRQEVIPTQEFPSEVICELCDTFDFDFNVGYDDNGLWLADDSCVRTGKDIYTHLKEQYLKPEKVSWLRDFDYSLYADVRDLFRSNDVPLETVVRKERGIER